MNEQLTEEIKASLMKGMVSDILATDKKVVKPVSDVEKISPTTPAEDGAERPIMFNGRDISGGVDEVVLEPEVKEGQKFVSENPENVVAGEKRKDFRVIK